MTGLPITHSVSLNIGDVRLGQTLPSLLDEACDRHPNDLALNQWCKRTWQSMSNRALQTATEECALGLQGLGLQPGDRVAMLLHNSLEFAVVDLGCALAGLVTVPIDLTQTIENILFILQHTSATTLVIANLELLAQLTSYLPEVPRLHYVIVAEVPEDWSQIRQSLTQDRSERLIDSPDLLSKHSPETCLHIPQLLSEAILEPVESTTPISQCIRLVSLSELTHAGSLQRSPERVKQLRNAIAPTDLATIIYIASETKRPKGVMLTHQQISANAWAAFSSHPTVTAGAEEIALLFLPLTHIFARVFLYGHLAYGHSIYLSDPNHLVRHLKTVKPTLLITVPRLLEKIHERILDQGQRLRPFDRAVFSWALKLAQRYEVGQPLPKLYALQLKLADRLVFAQWRAIFGDRIKALICGGAALSAELTNLFSAAGLPILQGYGLTESSGVVCYNRGAFNRAGTVGVPIPGVKVAIADDGEVLMKSPFVMSGYYRDPAATARAIDADGWLHTGDLGELNDSFLTLTGVKKPMFKLTTGKYVSPLPLEQEVSALPGVSCAIAVGANHKFCGMLIVPQLDQLRALLPSEVDSTDPAWLQHPCVLAYYQAAIDAANCHLPYWSTVRKFMLIDAELSVANGLLNADGTLNRVRVVATFAPHIEALYRSTTEMGRGGNDATLANPDEEILSAAQVSSSCPQVAGTVCPVYARSFTH